MLHRIKIFPLILATAFGLSISSPILAEESATLEEIVVTARARAESIQEIPLAVTAFTEDDFVKRGMEGLADVARFTSGFSFEDFGGGFGTPVIRSAAQTRLTAIEANVSTFYDGIYIPRAWAMNPGVATLSRIEVVKGPQSARYGRNAFMGAINLIPLQPSEETEGEISFTVGTDERTDFRATIAGALAPGLISGRLSFADSTFDGSWENTHPFADANLGKKGTNGNAGGWDNTSYSVGVDITPTERFKLGLALHNFNLADEGRGAGQTAEGLGTTNCGPIGFFGAPRLFCGEVPDPADKISVDPRSFGRVADVEIKKLDIEYQISDSIDLTYVFGNINGDVDIASGSEADPTNCFVNPAAFDFGCTFQNTPIGNIDYDSHELRFSGGDRIEWAVGAYVSDGEVLEQFAAPALPILTSAPTQPIDNLSFGFLSDVTTLTDVTAVFGEVLVPLSDRTRLSLEARYTQEEKTQINNASGATFEDDFNNFVPRVIVEHDLADDRLIYASLAQGVKSGGFNPTAADPADRTFDEESNWTLEFGSKNTFWNDRLQLNAALYYIQWSDIQLNAADSASSSPGSVNITLNLGDATTYGLELDAIAQLSDNFSVNAAFSYSDATYDDGTIDNRFARTGPFFFPNVASCDDSLCPSNGDVSGNQVERQAPTQLSIGAEWTTSLSAAEVFARADIAYQSEQEAESMNLSQIPARTIINGSLGMSVGNIDLTLWARNLTDERYSSNAFVVLLPFGNGYGNIFGERRTVGLNVSYPF